MKDELFHAARGQTDGGTAVTKLITAFRNFANAPKSQVPLTSKRIHLRYKNQSIISVYGINLCSEIHTNTDIPFRVRM